MEKYESLKVEKHPFADIPRTFLLFHLRTFLLSHYLLLVGW